VQRRASVESRRIERLARAFARSVHRSTGAERERLDSLSRSVARYASGRLGEALHRLTLLETRVHAHAPDRALERGYVLLRDSTGRLRTGVSALTAGDPVTLVAHDGHASATITSVSAPGPSVAGVAEGDERTADSSIPDEDTP
jgi:exonuclease VII large subunit